MATLRANGEIIERISLTVIESYAEKEIDYVYMTSGKVLRRLKSRWPDHAWQNHGWKVYHKKCSAERWEEIKSRALSVGYEVFK